MSSAPTVLLVLGLIMLIAGVAMLVTAICLVKKRKQNNGRMGM